MKCSMRSTYAFRLTVLIPGLTLLGCAWDRAQPQPDLMLEKSTQGLVVDPLDLKSYGISGGYAEVGGLTGKGCNQMTVTYKIVKDTRDTANPYYIATQQDFVDSTAQHNFNNRGYIGIQTYTDAMSPEYPAGKAVVFSMFDDGGQSLIVTEATAPLGSVCRCGADGSCGTGYSCFRPFEYVEGTTYTAKIVNTGNGVFEGYIDNGALVFTLIATITVPNSNGGAGNWAVQWSESFNGTNTCASPTYFKADVGKPVYSSCSPSAPTITDPNDQYGGNAQCVTSRVIHNSSSHTFEFGTPQPYTEIALKPKGSANYLIATLNDEGTAYPDGTGNENGQQCGNGTINNNSATFGKCSRFAEVSLGGSSVLLQTQNGRRIRCASGIPRADKKSVDLADGVHWTKTVEDDGYVSYKSGSFYLKTSGTGLSCSGTTLNNAAKFMRIPIPPRNTFRLRNYWQGVYPYDLLLGRAYYKSDTDMTGSGAAWEPSWWTLTQGITNTVSGTDYIGARFNNVVTGRHIHNEHNYSDNGHPYWETSMAGGGWYSASFTPEDEDTGGYGYRFNRFSSDLYINVENALGYLEATNIPAGYWSGWWVMEAVQPFENLALKAGATASSGARNKGPDKAKDGVVDSIKEWATVGGTVGSWIKYTWSPGVNVSCVWLNDRLNTNDQVTGGTLTFSNGDPAITVSSLPNSGSVLKQCFPTKNNLTWVRFTVTSVSGTTANVGLAEMEVH